MCSEQGSTGGTNGARTRSGRCDDPRANKPAVIFTGGASVSAFPKSKITCESVTVNLISYAARRHSEQLSDEGKAANEPKKTSPLN